MGAAGVQERAAEVPRGRRVRKAAVPVIICFGLILANCQVFGKYVGR